MAVKVTGQFEPAGDFSIVDGKDVSGNITGSNVSASGQLEAGSLGTNLASIISGSTPFDAAAVSGSWRGALSGSLNIISGSSTSIGSFNVVNVKTRVKAIGSSLEFAGNTLDFVDGSSTTRLFKGTAAGAFEAYHAGNKKLETAVGGINVTGHITASGDISGSSTSTGSFGNLRITGNSAFGDLSFDTFPYNSNSNSGQFITLKAQDTSDKAILELASANVSSGNVVGEIHFINRSSGAGFNPIANITSHFSQGLLFKTQYGNNGEKVGIRITEENNAPPEVIIPSGSLEVKGNVSGSSTSTGSFGRLESDTFNTTTFSSTEVTSTNLTVTGTITGSSLDVSGDGTFGGNIRAVGDVIAQRYIVSSSVTHLTQSFSSGSTLFGDSADDTHLFIGSKISGSSTTTGSFGSLFVKDGVQTIPTKTTFTQTSGIELVNTGNNTVFHIPASSAYQIGTLSNKPMVFFTNNTEAGRFDTSQNLLTTGNVSGSSTSTGSFGQVSAKNGRFTSGNDASGTISVLSGNSSQYSKIYVGTDSGKATIGVAGSNGHFFSNTLQNDLIVRQDASDKQLHLGVYDSNEKSNITISNTATTIHVDNTEQLTIQNNKISGSSTSTGSFGAGHFADKLGIGTVSIPHGGVGGGRLSINGADSNVPNGPALQMTTDSDNYPLFSVLPYAHDNIAMYFDGYNEGGGNKSSDAGSTYRIHKVSDELRFGVDSGVSAGSTATYENILVFDTSKNIEIGGNISGSSTSTGSFGTLRVGPISGYGAASGIAFGDGDTAIYEQSNDVLNVKIGTQVKWQFNGDNILSPGTNKAQISPDNGVTSPTFIPGRSHTDTGYGSNAGKMLSLIAGGASILQVSSSGTISGSSTSTGSFGRIILNDNAPIIGNDGVIVKGASASTGVNFRVRNGSGNDTFRVHGYGAVGIGGAFGDTGATTLHIRYIANDLLNTGTGINEYIRLEDNSNKSGSIGLGSNGNLQLLSQGGTTSVEANSGGTGNFTVAGKVHIGASSTPGEALTVVGNISGSATSTGSFGGIRSVGLPLFVNSDKVGIGTTAPYYKAHISFDNSTTAFSGGSSGNWGGNGLRIENTNSTADTKATLQLRANDYDALISAVKKSGGNQGEVHFNVDPNANTNQLLTLAGSKISGSSTSTGSFGAGFFADTVGMGVAPGNNSYMLNIEAAQTYAAKFKSRKTTSSTAQRTMIQVGSGQDKGAGIFFQGPSTNLSIGVKEDNKFHIAPGRNDIGDSSAYSVTVDTTGNLEVTAGDISGSATSTGSFGSLVVADAVQGNLNVEGGDLTLTKNDGTIFLKSAASNNDVFIRLNEGTSFNGGYLQYDGSTNIFNIGVHNPFDSDAANDTAAIQILRENNTGDVIFPIANQKISGSATSTGSFGRINATRVSASKYVGQIGSRFVHSQTSDSATWVINHNIGHKYPVVTVYDDSDQMILPQNGVATDSDTFTLTFNEAIQGKAVVSVGGIGENAGANYIHTQGASSTNWRVTHSLSQQYPNVTVYDDLNQVIIPESITAASSNEMDITFSSGKTGYANFSIGSGIPNISAENAGKVLKVRSGGQGVEWSPTSNDVSGSMSVSGSITPTIDNFHNLGSATHRWANLHTGDIQLSNEGTEGNEVDGTTGSWTIQEGEDDLYLLNRKNGKKYKFKLEEIT